MFSCLIQSSRSPTQANQTTEYLLQGNTVRVKILYYRQGNVEDMSSHGILTTNLAAVVCVCAQNLTNFCPHAFISNPNVPKILFA